MAKQRYYNPCYNVNENINKFLSQKQGLSYIFRYLFQVAENWKKIQIQLKTDSVMTISHALGDLQLQMH